MADAVHSFRSIGEFEKYINETPLNSLFRWAPLASSQPMSPGFNKTKDFPAALDLLKHGWEDMAKKIETKLKLMSSEVTDKTVKRSKYDVAGFQASVPRYLQGIPTSMINQKNVQQKQKVITIVKHIGYLANVTESEIIENSIKALQIVKKVEALGYRVNLDVISPAETLSQDERAVCRIRIKAAAERMNIAKVAFPMVHPDMLRRMIFRFREVAPELSKKAWPDTYGASMYNRHAVKQYLNTGDYYLHNFIGTVDDEIAAMQLK